MGADFIILGRGNVHALIIGRIDIYNPFIGVFVRPFVLYWKLSTQRRTFVSSCQLVHYFFILVLWIAFVSHFNVMLDE